MPLLLPAMYFRLILLLQFFLLLVSKVIYILVFSASSLFSLLELWFLSEFTHSSKKRCRKQWIDVNWLHVLRLSLSPLHCFLFCIFIGCTCCCYLRENLENLCDFFSPFANDDDDFAQSLGENDSEAQAGDGTKNIKMKVVTSHIHNKKLHTNWTEILKWRIITRNEKRIRKEAKFRNIRDGPEVKWKKQAEMFKNTLTGAQKIIGVI